MLIDCHLELLFFMINDLDYCCPGTCLEMKALTCQESTPVEDSVSARSESVRTVSVTETVRFYWKQIYVLIICINRGFPHISNWPFSIHRIDVNRNDKLFLWSFYNNAIHVNNNVKNFLWYECNAASFLKNRIKKSYEWQEWHVDLALLCHQ